MRLDLKLNSVVLENFRLFEKLDIDFHPSVTVLIGENGAGKTALVEGIAKMFQLIPAFLENPNYPHETPLNQVYSERDIKFGEQSSLCKVDLSSSIIDDGNGPSMDISETQHFPESIKSSIHLAKHTLNLPHGLQGSLTGTFDLIKNAKIRGYGFSIPLITYYPCEKVDNETSNGEKKSIHESDIFNTYESALNARAFDFNRFFEWFKWQEDRGLRGHGSRTLDIVRKAILSMLNDEGEEDKFTNIFVDVSSLDNYRLKLKKRDAELEVNQLSAGEKSLFALVSDIARRLAIANPQSEEPLQEGGGIVIIDEIDLHLHPRWQRKIVRKLTEIFPRVQFIITTHSPLILGSVRSENIRLLDDGQVYSVPETYGQNVGLIIKKIMGVEEGIFEDKIKDIFKLLSNNNVAEAKGEIAAIEQKSPADIPALREAKAILRRKETPVQ